MGPGDASGWCWTENTGRSLSAMPALVPSNSETWVSITGSGKLARSTVKPWFMETISTLPVVRSFTGWFAPWWPWSIFTVRPPSASDSI